MTFDKLQYIRTDRNGTKIYHDWTCPRCGGAGQADKWIRTGKVCFECGGTGKRKSPKIVKEYTEEYAAKLDARRIERDERKAANTPKPDPEEVEAKRREALANIYAMNGCGADGVGYVLKGNTYPIKNKIKAHGGKWIYGAWICPVEVTGDGVQVKRIDISGSYGLNGWISGTPDITEMIYQ